MSADGVDDLHAAEDFAGRAAAALRELADAELALGLAAGLTRNDARARMSLAWQEAGNVVSAWDSYCRPTCNPNDDGPHDEVCEEGDTCGCPCRNRVTDG